MSVKPGRGEVARETQKMDDYNLAMHLIARADAGRNSRLLPLTARQVARALLDRVAFYTGKQGAYTVESWNPETGGLKRSLGTLSRFDVAVGAFEAAVREFPDEHITMRERARVIRRHNDPDDKEKSPPPG